MPGALLHESPIPPIISCARCQVSKAALMVRAEHLCVYVLPSFCSRPFADNPVRECFIKYVATKVLKRVEVNKIRVNFKDPPKTLLLALSFGISSISMLQILDKQLYNHLQRSGRASYKLHVLYVDQSPIIEQLDYQKAMEIIKERFPSHEYSSVCLDDVFDYNVTFDEILFAPGALENQDTILQNRDRFKNLLSHLPSATSRYDIANILKLRLIKAYAEQHGCGGILYGDSTTRLAERTLAETAKGRGFSVPFLINDGLSTNGIKTSFPMRDLLKKELTTYANVISPPLTPLTLSARDPARHPVSSKDTTIDDLMSQYFESVEQNYPSIVANVIRTSSKLVVSSSSPSSPLCIICNLPTEDRPQKWGGDQESSTSSFEDNETNLRNNATMCYGCARSVDKSQGHPFSRLNSQT